MPQTYVPSDYAEIALSQATPEQREEFMQEMKRIFTSPADPFRAARQFERQMMGANSNFNINRTRESSRGPSGEYLDD